MYSFPNWFDTLSTIALFYQLFVIKKFVFTQCKHIELWRVCINYKNEDINSFFSLLKLEYISIKLLNEWKSYDFINDKIREC